MKAKQKTNPPIKKLEAGRVVAAIWQNETKAGIQYSVTFKRRYRKEDGKWADSTSFGRNDLLVVAELARQAFTTLISDLADDSGDVPEVTEKE
jgi:hypothetical protein